VLEDPLHFVIECAALAPERDSLTLSLQSDASFTALRGSSELLSTWCTGSPQQRLELILRSVESCCDELQGAEKLQYEFEQSLNPPRLRFEAHSLRFLSNIWRRRAELIGGVPSLNMTASKIVLSQLKEDGRSRSFIFSSSGD
jgi:hypothetical protein